MGRTLAIIADRVEASAHLAEVVVNEPLSPQLLRLVLRSDDFADATFEPCDVTAFRVSRKDFRHYTPAILDRDRSELTIIVQRHGDGPGAALIEGWVRGDVVRICQWSSTRAFHWLPGAEPLVVIGDATVISLLIGASERAETEGRELRGLLEVPAADLEAARMLVPKATLVAATDQPGEAMDAWLADHVEEIGDLGPAAVYLAGHGQSIQRQRKVLIAGAGLDRRTVKTQPYWATGKSGL